MAASLKHPHRYRLMILLTALHLIHIVFCSCISASKENLNLNLDSGKFCVKYKKGKRCREECSFPSLYSLGPLGH